MLDQLFATKVSMGQAWTKSGKRLVVSRLHVGSNVVIGKKNQDKDGYEAFQIGYGTKKLKNMTKPLQTQVSKSGFSFGVKQIREVKPGKIGGDQELPKVGDTIALGQVLKIGDIVKVQGRIKGRGFAGVVKRHGFSGGPRTHGQSDRERAPGSIGAGTTPGRVLKGKKMPGQYGNTLTTVKNLQVVFIDENTQEVWVNGPVPGHQRALVRLTVESNGEFEGLHLPEKDVKNDVEIAKEDITEEDSTEEVTA